MISEMCARCNATETSIPCHYGPGQRCVAYGYTVQKEEDDRFCYYLPPDREFSCPKSACDATCEQGIAKYFSQWGHCSAKCGGGHRYRLFNVSDSEMILYEHCSSSECNTHPCPASPVICGCLENWWLSIESPRKEIGRRNLFDMLPIA